MRRLDVWVLRCELFEDALPEGVAVRDRVALVGHADLPVIARARKLECMPDDPANAAIRVHLFLYGDLLVGVRAHPAASAYVQSLGVFSKDDEVDVAASTVLQRAQPIIE